MYMTIYIYLGGDFTNNVICLELLFTTYMCIAVPKNSAYLEIEFRCISAIVAGRIVWLLHFFQQN